MKFLQGYDDKMHIYTHSYENLEILLYSFNLINDRKFKIVINSTEKTLKIESILNLLIYQKYDDLCLEEINKILKLSYGEVIFYFFLNSLIFS